MFSYLGAKERLLPLYPKPVYDSIVEPFCGSARYACRYGIDKEVWINDLNPTIYGIWIWIQQASKQDIRSLPVLKRGEDLRDFKQLSQPERDLIGLTLVTGSSSPANKPTEFATAKRKIARLGEPHRIVLLKQQLLKRICGKISHWKITNLPYQEIPNKQATWFIDPPYQEMGHQYLVRDVDYKELGKWCKQRQGQVIVCEGGNANWLPFRKLCTANNNHNRAYAELIWYRSDKKQKGAFF